MYPEIPRLWKPAVSCLMCGYPNDSDLNFCQKCGFRKETRRLTDPPKLVQIDQGRIKSRLQSLESFKAKKPYQRQKSNLQKQLESFLWSLPDKKSVATAAPTDVIQFLVWRDQFGKTVLHSEGCQAATAAAQRPLVCNCQKGLSPGTIDNNIGKLRSIFRDNGRGAIWNEDLHLGNPAAHPSVKDYYKLVLEEHTVARVFPSKAVPFFLDKLAALCRHLRCLIKCPNSKPSSTYVLARDLAFFSVDFFSGDRGSDLGRVKSSDLLSFPDNKGFIFNQVFGKTLRGNGSNVFAIREFLGSILCPVSNLKFYLTLSKEMSIDLSSGYLFRVTDHRGFVSEAPFVGSTVANRLKRYLTDLSIDDGETMHSFRSGCSITLAALGVAYEDIAKHVGWKSVNMAIHYSQFDKVSQCTDPSAILATSATSQAEKAGRDFRERNLLRGFKPVFE